MTVTLLPAADRPAMPWKNGGGVTREVAVHPDPDPAPDPAVVGGTAVRVGPRPAPGVGTAGAPADFDWRISLADIAQAGPFSAFDGYDRVITLVSGRGMVLTIDGVKSTVDEPYRPLGFSGASTTECELIDGPIVDFNVMTRSGDLAATVEIVRLDRSLGTLPLPASTATEVVVIVVFEGHVLVTGSSTALLKPLDAAALHGEPSVGMFSPDATVAAVVRIGPA